MSSTFDVALMDAFLGRFFYDFLSLRSLLPTTKVDDVGSYCVGFKHLGIIGDGLGFYSSWPESLVHSENGGLV